MFTSCEKCIFLKGAGRILCKRIFWKKKKRKKKKRMVKENLNLIL